MTSDLGLCSDTPPIYPSLPVLRVRVGARVKRAIFPILKKLRANEKERAITVLIIIGIGGGRIVVM